MTSHAPKLTSKEGVPASNPAVICGSLPLSVVARGSRRLEGEAYLTTGYGIRVQLESCGFPYHHVSELAQIWMPDRLKGIVVSQEHGLPFLTPNQVFDRHPVVRKWLSKNQSPDVANCYAQPGWILITRSGNGMAQNVGKILASYSAHVGAVVSDDLLRVQLKTESDFGFLYSFLRSRFGRAMLSSNQYGGVIKHLEPEHVLALPVPKLDAQFRRWLDIRIRHVFALRDAALKLIAKAEADFQNALGMKPAMPVEEEHYQVSGHELFGHRRRLDAHHYNRTAKCVLDALRKSGREYTPLRKFVLRVFVPGRFKHVYGDRGTAYLDSEDIYKVNPDVTKLVTNMSAERAAEYMVKRDWLLMACSGQLYGINGSVVLATRAHEGKVLSNHIMRFVPHPDSGVRRGYLQMALGHPIFGRPLILRWGFGSGVPEIEPNDLLDTPIVRLGSELETRIADAVERASELQLLADSVENHAVHETEVTVFNEVLHQPARATPMETPLEDKIFLLEESRWHEFLAEYGTAIPGLSYKQMVEALRLWVRVRANLRKTPLPITTAVETGILNLAWNDPFQYLEVTIGEDGRFGWFYRHTASDKTEGSDEDDLEVVPDRVFDLLQHFQQVPT